MRQHRTSERNFMRWPCPSPQAGGNGTWIPTETRLDRGHTAAEILDGGMAMVAENHASQSGRGLGLRAAVLHGSVGRAHSPLPPGATHEAFVMNRQVPEAT